MTTKPKVAVKDANVFIDMEYMGILDLWFQLGYETITSDLVVRELEEGQHFQALAYVDSSQILALSLPLDVVNEMQQSHAGISSTDAAVLHLAVKYKALLLSGDRQLRNAARVELVEYHGSIWVLDQLVRNQKLTGFLAAEKLSALVALEGKQKRFLPEKSAGEQIKHWREMP
ncbi:MAG: hypothetical protein GVY36_09390 [Verrucomicrobia bacterium]|jgi:rRNA-processing protein FCF1|nr:hypothetical protein [Verrucomicrobiota bacterium]